MSDIEEKPLHEIILDIMYFKDVEKPSSFSPEDIFWQMKNPNISERQIKEVLEWLVLKKKVEKRFGKYQIDRYGFLDMTTKYKQECFEKEQKEERPKSSAVVEVVKKVSIKNKKKSFRKGGIFTKGDIFFMVLFCVLLGYIGYDICGISPYTISKLELKERELSVPSNLYISKKKTNTEEQFLERHIKDISHSFFIQNKTNNAVITEINSKNKEEIILKKELNRLSYSYQQEKEKIKFLFCNLWACIFILFSFVFLKIYKKNKMFFGGLK